MKPKPDKKPIEDNLEIPRLEGETDTAALARIAYDPAVRAIGVGRKFLAPLVGTSGLTESYAALQRQISSINAGDLSAVERKLVAQADTLDAIFNDMARRAALNAENYPQATETYLRMALKAQSQCRATLETLANIKHPPVVIARQANIAHGPQQVNNGAGAAARAHAGENNEIGDQSHAPEATRSVAATGGPPLLCHEQAVPIPLQSPSGEGKNSVPDARREGRSSDGASERKISSRARHP